MPKIEIQSFRLFFSSFRIRATQSGSRNLSVARSSGPSSVVHIIQCSAFPPNLVRFPHAIRFAHGSELDSDKNSCDRSIFPDGSVSVSAFAHKSNPHRVIFAVRASSGDFLPGRRAVSPRHGCFPYPHTATENKGRIPSHGSEEDPTPPYSHTCRPSSPRLRAFDGAKDATYCISMEETPPRDAGDAFHPKTTSDIELRTWRIELPYALCRGVHLKAPVAFRLHMSAGIAGYILPQ